jgi:hypothetical protein
MTAKSIHQVQIRNEETLVQRHRESSEYMPEGIRCEGTKFIYSGNHLHMSSSIIMNSWRCEFCRSLDDVTHRDTIRRRSSVLNATFPGAIQQAALRIINLSRLREVCAKPTWTTQVAYARRTMRTPLLKKRSSTDIKCIICSYLWPPDDCDVLTAADGEVSSRIRCPSLGSFQVRF